MNMKLKAGEIKIINEGLKEILLKELPVKPAYWLARIAMKLETEIKTFEQARMGLINKYSNKDEKGNPAIKKTKDGQSQFDITDVEGFEKEFNELNSQEIEIDIKPIKLADLGELNIKPVTLARLEKIIEE
jgi:hypothetical protein